MVAVTTAEEMPVNETLWLRDQLRADELGLDAVIVNARYPERFTPPRRPSWRTARERLDGRITGAALGAALSEHARADAQSEQLRRLHDGLGFELIELPYLFAEQIGRPELELLADALANGLPEPPRAQLNP